ncbi:kinase-like domain-containing protein [Tribonema minus]|uniref:non-specific serine/threonine protein kinase n=1 Tax=Tribonema minus TaxID=303371 RepID=A0A836CC15_9STRA|nr:kinase-like domain-containing protein [Tribonema minus]
MSHVSDGDHGDSGHHHHHLPVPGGAGGGGGGGGGRGRASTATSSSETRTRRGETHHYLHHYEEFTNNDIVDQAFEECDLDHDGKLSFSEFRLWMERNPVVARFLQSVFPYDEYRDWCGDAKHLPFIHNRDMTAPSPASHSPPGTPTRSSSGGGGDGDDAVRLLLRAKALTANVDVQEAIDRLVATLRAEAGVDDGVGGDVGRLEPPLPSASPPLPPMSPRSSRAMHHQTIAKKGFLAKRGHRLKSWMQRWYVLVGNCIYYYQHERDKAPRGVIFLAGSFVEPLHDDENERRGHWGLEITRSQEHGLRRCLYTNSKVERDKWVHELRRASEVVPVEEDFEIGEELGKGQFSRVCQCVNKHTLERKAVKIIEKETMDAEEKELLRAEIAIMKLVNHPNIIRMEAVYESRRHIFIVMELHSGGELFDRVNGRPRLTEDEAFCVIYPLIESVAYLHEMGIVHRDLKPENILCGQKVGDIKIADFGLSKLVLPDEIMKMPCGTLSYVAPEVLTLNGYGREADMWSVGTIMYLLLRGRLPFDIDGESREKIIERTINGTIDTDDAVWKALSQDARDLMLGLLNKDIKRRMSAKEALLHPWILSRVDRMDTEPETFDF